MCFLMNAQFACWISTSYHSNGLSKHHFEALNLKCPVVCNIYMCGDIYKKINFLTLPFTCCLWQQVEAKASTKPVHLMYQVSQLLFCSSIMPADNMISSIDVPSKVFGETCKLIVKRCSWDWNNGGNNSQSGQQDCLFNKNGRLESGWQEWR